MPWSLKYQGSPASHFAPSFWQTKGSVSSAASLSLWQWNWVIQGIFVERGDRRKSGERVKQNHFINNISHHFSLEFYKTEILHQGTLRLVRRTAAAWVPFWRFLGDLSLYAPHIWLHESIGRWHAVEWSMCEHIFEPHNSWLMPL